MVKKLTHKVLGSIEMNETDLFILSHSNYKIGKPDRYTHSVGIVINVSIVLRRLRKHTEKHTSLSGKKKALVREGFTEWRVPGLTLPNGLTKGNKCIRSSGNRVFLLEPSYFGYKYK